MNTLDSPSSIYVDQNILSHLREGKLAHKELFRLLRKFKDHNAVVVYSMTHVAECRDSSKPEQFVKVLEDLPAYLMEFENASDPKTNLSLGKACSLILEREGEAHRAERLMEDLLNILQYSSGWLGETEANELKTDMAIEMTEFWEAIKRNVEWGALGEEPAKQMYDKLNFAQNEMLASIKNLPFDKIRQEWQSEWPTIRERLPQNYAQLDEVPDEKAVSFVLSCLNEQDRKGLECEFPQGFWSKMDEQETGALAGLAFLLFMCGLVRDRRVKKGSTARRLQYFRGQFRDAVHIDNAARCALFMTFDSGAARLARAIYAYAGVTTKVIELQVGDCAK